jgi:hypothetical protein
MKHKFLVIIIALVITSSLVVSCTRSASGGPTSGAAEEGDLPNPVSTQSQTMKNIIAGTQTAMAIPLDATENATDEAAAPNSATSATGGNAVTATTPEPEVVKTAEVVVFPTSTAGPPPEVTLSYNLSGCQPGYYICEKEVVSNQKITIQSAHPYLFKDEVLTFTMGPEGEYDYSKYIVAGTAKYQPDGKGNNFSVTLNIPDALRGVRQIVVRLETKDPNRYGMIFFDN